MSQVYMLTYSVWLTSRTEKARSPHFTYDLSWLLSGSYLHRVSTATKPLWRFAEFEFDLLSDGIFGFRFRLVCKVSSNNPFINATNYIISMQGQTTPMQQPQHQAPQWNQYMGNPNYNPMPTAFQGQQIQMQRPGGNQTRIRPFQDRPPPGRFYVNQVTDLRIPTADCDPLPTGHGG